MVNHLAENQLCGQHYN